MAEKKLVATEKNEQLVKIKAVRAISVTRTESDGQKVTRICSPGEIVEVAPEIAAEYCDRVFKGTLEKQIQLMGDFDSMRPRLVRAERV